MRSAYSWLLLGCASAWSQYALSKPLDGKSTDVLMQGFTWLSADNSNWYGSVAGKAAELNAAGINMLWLPPPSAAESKEGYLPQQLNDLNSRYGSEAQLSSAIQALHASNIKVIADIVINHRNGSGNWHSFKNPEWGTDAIVSDDECWSLSQSSCPKSGAARGNNDSGGGYDAGRDIDHSKDYVRESIKTWLNQRLKGIGFDGWRYDYVKGYHGKYNGEYNQATEPYFSVGEYWTTLNPGNPWDHRAELENWVRQTGNQSMVFDFTTKGMLNDVIGWYKSGGGGGGHKNYGLLKQQDGKPVGLIGSMPRYAVTFVDNHDTGPSRDCNGGQVHWAISCSQIGEAYAYILTHPGLPSIYWGHYYDLNRKAEIDKLLKVRRDAGLHSESSVNIVKAEQDLYAAIVDDKVAMKMGGKDWNPGTGWILATSGNNYAVWTKAGVVGTPVACFKPDDAASIKLGDAISFDASCSTDPDGSIASYAWTLDGVAQGTNKIQLMTFNAEKAYKVGLKVTDNSGKVSEAKELSVNLGKNFAKSYDAVYVRGSFNTWGKADMQLTADNTWTLTQQLPAATELKFDAAPGNWSINFGDNQADGIADGGDAKNIKVATAGNYLISFNDKTRAYSIKLDTGCEADNDAMDDVWEQANGLDKCKNDAALDPDQDGLTNLQEFTAKTNPQNKDSDGDTHSDGDEVKAGTDPLNPASFPGCCQPKDSDGDGFSDEDEVKAGTDPLDKNSFPGCCQVASGKLAYQADFNGDGQIDLLWREKASGKLYLWLLQASGYQEHQLKTLTDLNWTLAAVADFNADARSDLLWHNPVTQQSLLWLMDGANLLAEQGLPQAKATEQAYALDLNADGVAEIVWRDKTSGSNRIWQLNSSFQVSESSLTQVPLDWQLQGVADTNADGYADMLWRHRSSGQTALWQFQSVNQHSELLLPTLSPDWQILAVQDVDGDAKAEILWRHQKTHEVYATHLTPQGFATDTPFLGRIPLDWQLLSLGWDKSQQRAELLWRHQLTGANELGLWSAGSIQQFQSLLTVPLGFQAF